MYQVQKNFCLYWWATVLFIPTHVFYPAQGRPAFPAAFTWEIFNPTKRDSPFQY